MLSFIYRSSISLGSRSDDGLDVTFFSLAAPVSVAFTADSLTNNHKAETERGYFLTTMLASLNYIDPFFQTKLYSTLLLETGPFGEVMRRLEGLIYAIRLSPLA